MTGRPVSSLRHRPPETAHQATRWDRHAARYGTAGLCRPCSGQAAWGHQLGFSQVHAPCAACTPMVATFPLATTTAWRKLPNTGLSAAQLCIPIPITSVEPSSATCTLIVPERRESATSEERVQP